MKNLRRNLERFFYRHRGKGIPNLMLWIAIGNVLVYVLTMIDRSNMLYTWLHFSRSEILRGQVWRLFTYIFLPNDPNVIFFIIMLFFYVQIGRFMEAHWGAFKFNLFYLTGVVIMDIAALLLNCTASVNYLNISLILSFATIIPESRVMLFFVIPLKMKYLAWFYFALTALQVVFTSFPYNLFPIFALLNYFLYFGSDVLSVLPFSGRIPRTYTRPQRPGAEKTQPNPNWADAYQKRPERTTPAYRHKCTVCGRTDTEHPGLEFRYCSRCNGYYCYCMEHINNHEHIQ